MFADWSTDGDWFHVGPPVRQRPRHVQLLLARGLSERRGSLKFFFFFQQCLCKTTLYGNEKRGNQFSKMKKKARCRWLIL